LVVRATSLILAVSYRDDRFATALGYGRRCLEAAKLLQGTDPMETICDLLLETTGGKKFSIAVPHVEGGYPDKIVLKVDNAPQPIVGSNSDTDTKR